MRLDRHLTKSRIVEIESKNLQGALRELLSAALGRVRHNLDEKKILKELLRRENTMTTCLGNGVALPHLRLKMKRNYLFAVGRCRKGLEDVELAEYRQVRLIFLLLASEEEKSYLTVLASLARVFRNRALVDKILEAPTLPDFQERLLKGFGRVMSKPERHQARFNRLLLREAEKVARTTKSSAILIFSDTFAGGVSMMENLPKYRTLLVTRAASEEIPGKSQIEGAIEVRSFSRQRLSQARCAVLIGLTRGLFKYNDRICCIGGLPSSNQFDSLLIIDVEREFEAILGNESNLLPASVKNEVIERMLGIATELSIEGREGRPVGGLFVIGDTEKVLTMTKPLVLNPFYGYKQEERNVLNPFMDETIKEFSFIDGCFVIRGNGAIESAGSLIHAPAEFYRGDLPGGFGARHAAAAAISRAADCIAIVVSASSGQVTLFRRGVMLPLLEKPIGGAA